MYQMWLGAFKCMACCSRCNMSNATCMAAVKHLLAQCCSLPFISGLAEGNQDPIRGSKIHKGVFYSNRRCAPYLGACVLFCLRLALWHLDCTLSKLRAVNGT